MSLSKNKKLRYPLVIIVLIAMIASSLYFVFFKPKPLEAAWWDDNWSYRQKVEITNSGSAQTDFQVMVTLDSSTLITAGKMQSDCDDIRVTDINGKKLYYWLEPNTCNTSSTYIWTKVPSIPTTNATIYLYYGNPSASSESSTANTFIREITGVQGAWNMDEASWTNDCSTDAALDSSGNSNHGTACPATTGPTGGATGKFGNAGDFDGSNDYVDCGTGSSLDITKNISVAAWIKPDSLPDWAGIVTKMNGYQMDEGYGMYFLAAGEIKFYVTAYDQNVALKSFTADGQWHHVVGTYDKSDVRIYVDGVEGTSDSYTGDITTATGKLLIARLAPGTNGDIEFDGLIDEVRIYNQALSSDEISDLYGTGGDRHGYTTTNYPNKELVRKYSSSVSVGSPGSEEQAPGPVAYWKFDEGTDNTCSGGTNDACDSTSNNNDGAMTGGTWQTPKMCVFGYCMFFDGSDDVLTVTNNNTIDFDQYLASGFTFQGWVRVNSDGENSVGQIFNKGTNTYLRITNEGTDGLADLEAKVDLSTAATLTITNGITLNHWHHIALTYTDDSDDEITLYIDGQNKGSSSDGAGAPDSDSNNLLIGGSSTANFHGFIDDFKIYKTERSLAQIRSDYLKGAGPHGASAVLGAKDLSYLSHGLVGYWKMDDAGIDAEGETSTDSSGNANDGTLYGDNGVGDNGTGMDCTAGGKYGTGCDFDGTDDYVSISVPTTGLAQLTLSGWFKLDVYQAGMIVGADSNTALGMTAAWGGMYFRLDLPTSKLVAAGTPSTNVWYHQVGTYDGSNMRIYINGVLKDTEPATGSVEKDMQLIGKMSWNAFLDGLIDEVRVYNRALSPAEVQDLYEWAPGPVGYWSMDENTGTGSNAVKDRSGNDNHGTMEASMTEDDWVPGKFGSALDFDGSDDYVGATGQLVLGYPFTMSAWVKAEGTDYKNIVQLSDASKDNVYYRLYIGSDDVGAGQRRAIVGRINAGTFRFSPSTTEVVDGQWHHIVATFVSATEMSIWVDGIKENTETNSVTYSTNVDRWDIGRAGDSTPSNYFDGLIDDVRIYNYARTQKQIIEDMNAGHPAVGSPVGSELTSWKFDEGYGTTAYDSSNNSKNLTLSTASWTNSGKFGKAFDGGDNKRVADGADDDDLDFAATESFSLSAWAKYGTSNPAATEYILHKQTGNEGYALYMDTDGDLIFGIGDTSSTSFPEDTAGNIGRDYADNSWHHLVGVKTSNSKIEMYVDGNLISSDTSLAANDTLENSAILYIGDANATDGTDEFLGDIDEVKIYNFALTEDEVKLEYNRGASVLMGATGTDASGNPSWSSERSYCPPGDTTANCGPVAEWKMDEKVSGDSQTLYDTSENSNDGTTYWGANASGMDCTVPGKYGTGCDFDGVDDYVDVADNSLFSPYGGGKGLTISLWINPDDLSDWTHRSIVGKNASGNYEYSIRICGNELWFRTWPSNGATYYYLIVPTLPTADWHHVVFVLDYIADGTGSLTGYIDGVYVSQDTVADAANMSDGTANLTIGGASGGTSFNGLIDDVRIYNYALSQAQIAWEYNRGRPVAHWKFDECQGSTVYDWEGSNNGTITIGDSGSQDGVGTCTDGDTSHAWYNGHTGKWNYALNFDGSDDVVSVGDTGYSTIRSLSFWAKPNDTTEKFIELSASDSVEVSSGTLTVTGFGTETVYIDSIQTTSFPDANWHLVTVASDTDITANAMNIGKVSTTYYNGLIDDVRIYNYALTEQQIRDVYNQGSAVRFGPETGAP